MARIADIKKSLFEQLYECEKNAFALIGETNPQLIDTKIWYEGGIVFLEKIIFKYEWYDDYFSYRAKRDREK